MPSLPPRRLAASAISPCRRSVRPPHVSSSCSAPVRPFPPALDPVLGPSLPRQARCLRAHATSRRRFEAEAPRPPALVARTAFLSGATPTSRRSCPSRLARRSRLLARLDWVTAAAADSGLAVTRSNKGKPVVDMIRKRRFRPRRHTPEAQPRSEATDSRGRSRFTHPCITTLSALLMGRATRSPARGGRSPLSLQERIAGGNCHPCL